LLKRTVFSPSGEAIDHPDFVVAPASFNAIAADAATTLGELIGDTDWVARGRALAATLDDAAWDGDEALWSDIAFTGGGASVRIPTMDAALPAMCTPDPAKAAAALRQLTDPSRFGAPYGPRFVAKSEPTYNPVQYWRGPAWPQLNYLAAYSARHCGQDPLAAEIGRLTKSACLRAGFAEYWNPETGRGLGARPQSWAAVAAAM
jgi:glycogen debranching enzyme